MEKTASVKKSFRSKFSFNAPVVLGFALFCVGVQLISMLTRGASNRALFSVYRSSFADPLAYLRCLLHVAGHRDWGHLLNNMMYIMLLGPLLEEKYGHKQILLVMVITALTTGVINLLFFPSAALLGASGIVFAMIMLSSITETRDHKIPVTFIVVAILYMGVQVYNGLFTADNISQMAHIVGGLVGTVLGFALGKMKKKKS